MVEEKTEKIIPADQLLVKGLSPRNRIAGMGVPFVLVKKQTDRIPIKRSVPGTMFLRIEGSKTDLSRGRLKGQMELYSPFFKNEVLVADRNVTLESDLSVQLAYTLNQTLIWDLGF